MDVVPFADLNAARTNEGTDSPQARVLFDGHFTGCLLVRPNVQVKLKTYLIHMENKRIVSSALTQNSYQLMVHRIFSALYFILPKLAWRKCYRREFSYDWVLCMAVSV